MPGVESNERLAKTLCICSTYAEFNFLIDLKLAFKLADTDWLF